jgi:amino acid transporter
MNRSDDTFTPVPADGPAAATDGPAAETGPAADQPVKGTLGLWDAVSIIVGIVVGAGIYQTAPFILFASGSGQVAMTAWAIGGLVSFVGALCYAELATTYPRDGGDIVYLSRAFGRWVGFLFGWVQLTVILTGSIGAMAFVFANYSIRLLKDGFGVEMGFYSAFALAGGAILLLTVLNVLGVVFGKVVQNVLTLAKVLGLTAIVVAGFMAPTKDAFVQHSEPFTAFPPMIGVALVLILYTYGGWNDAAFVAAEVRNGKKNITRSLLIGIALITALYLLVNYAYISSQGYSKAAGSSQIAADVLQSGFGKGGVVLMCVLVMISALGAVNGLIFTGARVYATIGKDYSVLRWMAGWARDRATPVPALVTQGVLALGLVFLVGTTAGRDAINRLLEMTYVYTQTNEVEDKETKTFEVEGKEPGTKDKVTVTVVNTEEKKFGDETVRVPRKKKVEEKVYVLRPMAWEGEAREGVSAGENATNLANGAFTTLVTCTAPIFWGFFLLTGVSLFVLRERDRHVERPFKVPLYPVLPLVFCLSCGYMLYSSTDFAFFRGWKGGVILLGVVPLVVGLVLYGFTRVRADGEKDEVTP